VRRTTQMHEVFWSKGSSSPGGPFGWELSPGGAWPRLRGLSFYRRRGPRQGQRGALTKLAELTCLDSGTSVSLRRAPLLAVFVPDGTVQQRVEARRSLGQVTAPGVK
jgi:hypothetical protein